jgi:hypothetical protein
MTPRRQRRIGLSLAAAAVLATHLAATPASASEERPETWRVLVLNASDFYMPGSVRQNQAMRSALSEHAPRRVQFRAEALDAANFDLVDYEREVSLHPPPASRIGRGAPVPARVGLAESDARSRETRRLRA